MSVSLTALLFALAAAPAFQWHTGDVVLQESQSSRSALIRRASHSPYSHVGLIEVTPKGVFVIEAIQPVSRTPIAKWVKRGAGAWVTVLRAKDLDEAARQRVVDAAKTELGKPYDAKYRWDDEKIYCSELVAKAFLRGAERTVGRQQTIASLQLTPQELAWAGKQGVTPEDTLLTPASLAEDSSFEVIAERATTLP